MNSKYDLTPKIAPFLDLHMVVQILQIFETNIKIYEEKEILQSLVDLLHRTHMVDWEHDFMKQLGGATKMADDLKKKKTDAVALFSNTSKSFDNLKKLLESHDEVESLKANKCFNAPFLEDNFKINNAMIEKLYDLAKIEMDMGRYEDACSHLDFYLELSEPDTERYFLALWGVLAASICNTNHRFIDNNPISPDEYDALLRRVSDVRVAIDNNSDAPVLNQLQQRSWLLHWLMFVVFHKPDPVEGCSILVDFCLKGENYGGRDNEYLQAIQVNCPWLLRYLTAAVITCGSGSAKDWGSRNALRDLVKVIQHEREKEEKDVYSDPITEFVEALLVEFNFDAAQEKLKECEAVIRSDFLFYYGGELFIKNFMEKARFLIFETFFQIHTKIDIENLALRLNMKPDEAEMWMVTMIRNADLDAKIDSENSTVIMSHTFHSVHQQIIEKTKDLSFRSGGIVNILNKTKY